MDSERLDLPTHRWCALRLHRIPNGCRPHAQHRDAHRTRPSTQHLLLPHGHLCAHGRAGQGVCGVWRSGSHREDPAPAHEACFQPPGCGLAGCCPDLPQRQPRHHHAGKGHPLQWLLQEVPVHLPDQLRYGLRYGPHRDRLHDGTGLHDGAAHRIFRCLHGLRRLHPLHAVFRAESLSRLPRGERPRLPEV